MRDKTRFTVIEGGKGKEPAPQAGDLSSEFEVFSFMQQGGIIDCSLINSNITPDMYGKTIDGVTYGDPTKQVIILTDDDKDRPFDFNF